MKKKVLWISKGRIKMSSKQKQGLGPNVDLDRVLILNLDKVPQSSVARIKDMISDYDIIAIDTSIPLELKTDVFNFSTGLQKDVIVPKYNIVDTTGDELVDLDFAYWERLLSIEFKTEKFEGY